MNPQLTEHDFERLASLMTGPHGREATGETTIDLLVVFGAFDVELAKAAASLYAQGRCKMLIFSGGVGKDSGPLLQLGISEAVFLASVGIANGVPAEVIVLEERAANGRENALFALELARDRGILAPGCRMASLAPAARSRRLYEELRFQSAAYHAVVIAGFSAGSIRLNEPRVRQELFKELQGLFTMDKSQPPRIAMQSDLQLGGSNHDLVLRAGLV
jgi:hypothetical protein